MSHFYAKLLKNYSNFFCFVRVLMHDAVRFGTEQQNNGNIKKIDNCLRKKMLLDEWAATAALRAHVNSILQTTKKESKHIFACAMCVYFKLLLQLISGKIQVTTYICYRKIDRSSSFFPLACHFEHVSSLLLAHTHSVDTFFFSIFRYNFTTV